METRGWGWEVCYIPIRAWCILDRFHGIFGSFRALLYELGVFCIRLVYLGLGLGRCVTFQFGLSVFWVGFMEFLGHLRLSCMG